MLIEAIAHPLSLKSSIWPCNEIDWCKALADHLRTSTKDLQDETMDSDPVHSKTKAEALIGVMSMEQPHADEILQWS